MWWFVYESYVDGAYMLYLFDNNKWFIVFDNNFFFEPRLNLHDILI